MDENGRMTVANPGSPKERSYTYDNNGNLTSVTSPGDTVYNATFTYDALNRVTNATGSYGTAAYTYDNVGNRLTKTLNSDIDTYAYLTDTNRLDNVTNSETVNYTYDSNGNVTGIGDRTIVTTRTTG